MKMKLSEFKNRIKIEWIFLAIVIFIVYASHNYRDFYETMRHGMTFWTALFDGHPLQFYEYCNTVPCGNDLVTKYIPAVYDFTIYLIFAIWNFPLWLIERINGGNIQNSFIAILYAKSMLIVAMVIIARLLGKIIEEITGEEKGTGAIAFTYLSSSVLLASALIIGQYDVLCVIFILLGLLYYLRGDHKRFILYFMIANSMKYFAILLMLPLLCIKEKNVLKIIRDMAASMIITVLFKLLFTLGGNAVGLGNSNGLIGILVSYNIFGGISIFWVAYFMLLIYCYKMDQNIDKSYLNKVVVYVSFIPYLLMYLFSPAYPYWIVLLVPFSALLIHTNKKNIRYNIVLTTLFETCILLRHFTWYSWCYDGETFIGMLIYKLTGNRFIGITNLGAYMIDIFNRFKEYNIIALLTTGFTAAGIAMICLNVPKDDGVMPEFVQDRTYMIVRMLISSVVVLLPIIYYIGIFCGVFAFFE